MNQRFAKYPSKIEWDLTNGPRSVSWDRAIRYSGLGVRSGTVLLEISWKVSFCETAKRIWQEWMPSMVRVEKFRSSNCPVRSLDEWSPRWPKKHKKWNTPKIYCWATNCLKHTRYYTPRKFNIAPENRPSQKENSLPTIIFQGLY